MAREHMSTTWTTGITIQINVMGPSRTLPTSNTHRRRIAQNDRNTRETPQPVNIDVSVTPHSDETIPSQESSLGPIRFYNCDELYYEFTNFAPASIKHMGARYPTAEHLFQAHKFFDAHPDLAERIRKMPTPRAALQEATRLQRLQRQDWFQVNIEIMNDVLEAKFSQHRSLRKLLLETGERALIEASPVDSFWGIGPDGQGRNELGKALMRLRNKMRAEGGTHNIE